MDITILAAWGEFLGGIAVIVSLVYLASQIRQNTKTVRASNLGDQVAAASEWNTMIADPDAASLYVCGLDDFVGLGPEEQLRFSALIGQLFGHSLRAWHFRELGLYDEEMFESQTDTMAYVLGSLGARQCWTANQHWYPARFRDYMNGLIRAGEAAA